MRLAPPPVAHRRSESTSGLILILLSFCPLGLVGVGGALADARGRRLGCQPIDRSGRHADYVKIAATPRVTLFAIAI